MISGKDLMQINSLNIKSKNSRQFLIKIFSFITIFTKLIINLKKKLESYLVTIKFLQMNLMEVNIAGLSITLKWLFLNFSTTISQFSEAATRGVL